MPTTKIVESSAGSSAVLPVGAVRFRTMEWIERLEAVSSVEASMLLYFAHRIDQRGDCLPGRPRIAKATKLHPNTISRAIHSLERKQLISVRRSRSKKGNRFYERISVNVPLLPRAAVADAGTTLEFSPDSAPVPAQDEAEHQRSALKESLIDGRIQEEVRIEAKAELASVSEFATPPPKLTVHRHAENTQCPSSYYRVSHADELAIEAMVWWDLYGARAGDCPIGRVAAGGQVLPLDLRDRQAIRASRLAADYWNASQRSPKARVAYWHEIGRLYHPPLPRFGRAHRLSALQSKHLHSMHACLGRPATYVIAWAFANWGGLHDMHEYKGPTPEAICDASDYLMRNWIESLEGLGTGSHETALRERLLHVPR